MRRVSALLAYLAAATLTLSAQTASRTIQGRVVADSTGEPIRNARVGTAEGPDALAALTDSEGRFTLAPVPADQRELFAAKTGYVRTTVTLSDAPEIRLMKGGVIAGRVLDDMGVPMPLMNVAAFRVRRAGSSVTFERFRATETDDLGEYRLFGLPAGEFVVAAAPGRFGTATTTVPIDLERLTFRNYYPHAETPEQAQPMTVKPGEEIPGIDFTVQLPAPGPLLFRSGPPPYPPVSDPPGGRNGSASIEGRVAGANGLPVRRARVQIASGEQLFSPYQAAPTDDDGRYEFKGLKAGTYFIVAGTLDGRPTPFSSVPASDHADRIVLAAGEAREHVDITVPSGGVISGRILDEYGDPMANANVHLDSVQLSRGRRRLVPVPSIASRQTDDRGRYRIFGLPPGKYLVGAIVGEALTGWQTADWPGYARTYFPGTPVPAEAQPVELGAGQQSLNVDFSLIHGRLARISGRATTSTGSPLQGVVALAQSVRSGAIATSPVHVQTEGDGSFAFTRIPPGEYVVQASTRRSSISSEGEFALQYVTVDGTDVSDLNFHLSTGSTIEGRITFEGGAAPEDPELHISPISADPDIDSLVDNAPARADVHDDLTFEISGVTGPRRLAVTQASKDWALKTIRVGGVEATDAVFTFGTPEQSLRDVEVVLTKRITTLEVNLRGQAAGPNSRVVAFAVDRERRYSGSRFFTVGVPDRTNAVTLRGLPPGDYYIAALNFETLAGSTAADDGEFQESLVAGAEKVTLTEGERRSVSVNVSVR